MTIQTAIRVLDLMTGDGNMMDKYHRLRDDGVITPDGVDFMREACKVAVECMKWAERMQDDCK